MCRAQERSGAQKEPATASHAAERSLSPENKSTACQRNFSISHPLKPLKRAAMELRMPAYLLAFMRIVFYKLCPQVLRNRLEHLSLKTAGWSGWGPRCLQLKHLSLKTAGWSGWRPRCLLMILLILFTRIGRIGHVEAQQIFRSSC